MTESTSPDPTSLLANLGARREQLREQHVLPLYVPEWNEPAIRVTFRSLQFEEHDEITRRAKKIKRDSDRLLAVAQDAIIKSCVSVEGEIDGARYSFGEDPHGEPTRFDPEMAARLPLGDTPSARDVVRFFYWDDGALLSTYFKVMEFSKLAGTEVDEAFEGE